MKILWITAICLIVFSGMAQESRNRSGRIPNSTYEEMLVSVRTPTLFRASAAASEKVKSAFDELAPFLYIFDGKNIIQAKIPEVANYKYVCRVTW